MPKAAFQVLICLSAVEQEQILKKENSVWRDYLIIPPLTQLWMNNSLGRIIKFF